MSNTESDLLRLLNRFLKHNSKSRKAQKAFEGALKEYLGVDELNDVMDWYTDIDENGTSNATMRDIEIIIQQGKQP